MKIDEEDCDWEQMEKAFGDMERKRLYRPYPDMLEFLVKECGWERGFAQEMLTYIRNKN